MEPLTILFASSLAVKVIDEMLAKSKNKKLEKYVGSLSWIAKGTLKVARILMLKR